MADYTYIDSTGVIVPDTSTLLAQVQGEYQAALGADVILDSNTPQGSLIAAEVVARQGVLANNATLANQINPNLAAGVFLDAIWALTGGQRLAATFSLVKAVTLTGLPGTVIPAGSQASLPDGTLFQSVSGVVLDGSGNGTSDFQAVLPGPTAVSIGELNLIVTGVLGWDAVSNPTATDSTTIGQNQETDLASRQRRKNTLSLQNVSLPKAISSHLYATPGVTSLTFRENKSNTPQTIDGIAMLPNSIYVCVNGGTDLAVATSLLASKSGGCDWNGGTTVNVTEPTSGQAYTVSFDRPTAVPIQARVTVRNINSITDPATAVRNAVLAYAAGQIDGAAGFVVGGNASPFEIGGAVMQEVQGLYVQKVELSLVSLTSWSTNEIAIALNQIATILAGNIIVVVL